MKKPTAPAYLSNEAKRLWRQLQDEYVLDDSAGLLILQTCLEAFDRMRSAQHILEKDGLVFMDKAGNPRQHPLVVVERDARAAMLAGLKQLNLDLEPLKSVGRPPGR